MKGIAWCLLLALASCTLLRRAPLPTPQEGQTLTKARRIEDPPAPALAPPTDATLLPADSPEVQAALGQYTKTGKAPVIEQKNAGFVRYPFGLSQPVVVCQPLRVCDIELEPGEQILGTPVCGDGGKDGRWVIDGFLSGPAGNRTPHVTVKPTEWHLATNLTIGTDRRVYYIALVAKPNAYVRRIGFYYPEDAVAKFNALRQERDKEQRQVAVTLPLLSLDQLDDRYTIEGDTAWRPTWVANDGTHTYVKLPLEGAHSEAPALFVQTPQGTAALVNYRVKGGYYVVDRVFDQAVLTRGTGRDKQTVTITRARR